MANQPRLSLQTVRVLDALLTAPSSSGADISKATGLASGTLYPILLRLEQAGWLSSNWEAGDPATLGRPRKRFYRVTAEGARNYNQQAQAFAPAFQRLALS